MANSVYKVIELIGSSPNSWEEAVSNAVAQAGQELRELRVAEVDNLDVRIENGKVTAFRAKVHVSFKYEGGD
ncbi:MAG: dodecin domain-containing protein [Gammaproteobacteria bacterium]|nr:dodecin domain-containing protein [Gammaproteobacteria bacterium]